jgi:hypothetical protein
MKNTLYAFISCLLVMFILFMLFTNLDLFNQPVVEGNVSKKKSKAKAAATPIRQAQKREEKKLCVGKNCKDWKKNKDIISDAPDTVMNDMRAALDLNNDDSIKDLTQKTLSSTIPKFNKP